MPKSTAGVKHMALKVILIILLLKSRLFFITDNVIFIYNLVILVLCIAVMRSWSSQSAEGMEVRCVFFTFIDM